MDLTAVTQLTLRILVVHPVMTFLGGGERLCCETIRALLSAGHEITLLSSIFNPSKIEAFFGYTGLFNKVDMRLYPPASKRLDLASTSHIMHHVRQQRHAIKNLKDLHSARYDLLFSTQDPGYIPDTDLPVVQWGYFPRIFPNYPWRLFARKARETPLRLYYGHKISRIALVLAISNYSKRHLDEQWKRPSVLVYPACNMVEPARKRPLVVTVARATPVKRLELFWEIAKLRPQYEFVMLLTRDPSFSNYPDRLTALSPSNGRVIFDPPPQIYHKILGEASAYLHLMRGEHFGIVVVEAMSAGCIPVVHDSGGPREIVANGTGFRWQREEEIPSMIDQAITDAPSKRAILRAEEFSVDRFDARLSSIFHGPRS